MRWSLLVVLVLSGCQEYGLHGKDTGNDKPDDSDDTNLDTAETGDTIDHSCDDKSWEGEEVALNDDCGTTVGTFDPVVEWEELGRGSLSLPTVGDLDGDGIPEIVVNTCDAGGYSNCRIYAHHGDGSGLYAASTVVVGYGTGPALGDLDGDGSPEVVTVGGAYEPYQVVAMDNNLDVIWTSESFTTADMDYSTFPVLSDMDHDGSPEIVAGRVILNADGTTRGVGSAGRGGAYLSGYFTESSIPIVADIDLDGTEEVIVGNAQYDPDGYTIASNALEDGIPALGNLDDDPEGELIITSQNRLRMLDTDMSVLYDPGPFTGVNIMGPAAIGDLDNDDEAEYIVAIGATLRAFHRDNTLLWSVTTQDGSGATGPALFDFEGDGIMDVAYADEIDVIIINGTDGSVKYRSPDHDSPTMYDTPTIADVDNDGHAEIVVTHMAWGSGKSGFSVYGDADESWVGTRPVWNQHAYGITNINDDLSIPTNAEPPFVSYNLWHAQEPQGAAGPDAQPSILDVCTDDCDDGWMLVAARFENTGNEVLEAGVKMALYGMQDDDTEVLLDVATNTENIESGWTGTSFYFTVPTSKMEDIVKIAVRADDDGTGWGALNECDEDNNWIQWGGDLCP